MMDLRYFIKALFLPPFTQLLILLGAYLLRKRFPRVSWTFGFFAIASLWALAAPVTANYLAKTLEQTPIISPAKLANISADAIIILSGGQNETTPEFGQPVSGNEQLARIRYGAMLQRATDLPILLSGGSVRGDEKRSLAETMAFDLERGYGGKANWLEKKSRTTAENAKYSYAILAAKKKTTILLVTSALHMPRSKWSFEQVGFKVIPAPTNFTPQKPLIFNSFIPNAHSLKLSSQVLHEWLGILTYQLLNFGN